MRTAIILTMLGGLLVQGKIDAQTFSSEAAHEHGVAALDIAQEGMALDVYLQSPLANLLGFEHAAKDAAQRQQVAELTTYLQSGLWLQLPPAANCRVASTDLQGLAAAETAVGEAAADVHQPEHQHDHKHEHEHAKPHDHTDDEPHKAGHSHADLQLTQRFVCQNPLALSQIEVPLFAKAVDLQRLNVQWVNLKGQGATTLTKASTVLTWQAN